MINQKCCPACGESLSPIKGNDGYYCNHCGILIDFFRYSATGPKSQGMCPGCRRILQGVIIKSYSNSETVAPCYFCRTPMHSPRGNCPSCWEKLTTNGTCVNRACPKFQQKVSVLAPVYLVQTVQPHCQSCGQAFTVFKSEIGNKDVADIAWSPNGWIWVSSRKGCSQCGSAFSP